ncbi:porin family protein [Tenacibaculum maritimum]|uniref:porin family protein n=1 Tax=Tenacibaculum maritimum TaxID=107401 RepID=UPI0012E54657|nr:porin family protein [Tenacibaculum maritimum]CAA0205072.1 putative Outer membrane protein beta-barrel domain-containing protein [Tenacibaculum maritimum]
MKKTIFTLAILFTSLMNAQDLRFGAKGGFNLADISAEISSSARSISINTDGKTSFYIGGFVEFSTKVDRLLVEAGLYYFGNGTKSTSTLAGGDFNGTLSIDQLNLPILAKYEIIENLYVKGGMYLGYILGAETKDKRGITTDAKDNFGNFDLGMSIGAEYNLENGLFIDAGYMLGLLNIADEENVTIKNRSLLLGVGYKF